MCKGEIHEECEICRRKYAFKEKENELKLEII
jgi:hypothetical protein